MPLMVCMRFRRVRLRLSGSFLISEWHGQREDVLRDSYTDVRCEFRASGRRFREYVHSTLEL